MDASGDLPDPGTGEVLLQWLGQAGFYIRWGSLRLLVDPYLSDALSVKYAGTRFPHRRMMPPPRPMESFAGIDYCFCTHGHSDHMDPGFLPVLAEKSPGCRFVIPRAAAGTGLQRGIPRERLTGMNAREVLAGNSRFSVKAIPAAHEDYRPDARGEHPFLGYIFRLGDLRIYHSGDCVPYPGLAGYLAEDPPDLALLPVNGRREELTREGIVGNFSFSEALALTEEAGIPFMIPHHYGMFDFNTIDTGSLTGTIRRQGLESRVFPAENGAVYRLERRKG